MTTISESLMRLYYISLLLLCCVSPSSLFFIEDPDVGPLVACHPHQIETFTQFKTEFDTRNCNQSDDYNGVWCDNSTGVVIKLQLRSCLSGTLKPNSSLFGFHQLRYLDLRENNFASSSLPWEIGNLNRLELLILSSNGFISQVPSSISNLTQLSILDLSQNEFIGSFPFISNLTKLSALELSVNHFTGKIPISLLTMPFLFYLNLNGNHLTGPIEVPNSSTSYSLKFLNLGLNHFEGQILEPISKLINLEELDLSSLNISYSIDINLFSSLKSLLKLYLRHNSVLVSSLNLDSNITTTLKRFDLSYCDITEFPNILQTLNNLRGISISGNKIRGQVPKWFWNLPKLRIAIIGSNYFNSFEGSKESLVNSSVELIDLHSNRFKGAFPVLPHSIKTLYARNNSFTGDIPLSFCNRSSLTVIDLSYNNFTGPIPRCLNSFKIVKLRKNNLQGNLPDVFHVGNSIRTLDVGYNQLTGKLPKSLVNCSSMKFLSVDHNRIVDTFPFWITALPNIQVFRLRSNSFYGPISPPLDQGPLRFPELRIFELSNNNFSGRIPENYFLKWKASSVAVDEYGKMYMGQHIDDSIYDDLIDLEYKGVSMEQMRILNSFSAIDLSGNRLEGEIPESIGLLKTLIALNLSNNAFTGHIPLSLANLTEMESLDLSRNQLSGTIPNALKTLSYLAYINVSHNQLKGEIPQGTQITGQAESSFEGNTGLCGLPLSENCSGTARQKKEEEEEEEEEEDEILNWKALVIGVAPGFLFGLALAQAIASYKPEFLDKIIGPNKR